MANQARDNSEELKSFDASSESLSDRALRYRDEIEKIVMGVGEHPLCEMKRACSLQDLSQKVEFAKDIQSIATSRIDSEKFLVIGVDEVSKSFAAVQNQAEFDDAAIRQLLGKYLVPAPQFEIFRLKSSEGIPFVVIVIPKQQSRRILAKATVEDRSGTKQKLLLREGDLWTKGATTGKRLAQPEDWDDIYSEIVETRVELQTRQRTAHLLEVAVARERISPNSRGGVPSAFNDLEFKALLEDLCTTQDAPRFNLLLERLRDDLVEGWYRVGGYERFSFGPNLNPINVKQSVADHIRNVFRPAMHWLTLAGIYTVKSSGPRAFFESVVALLAEVFNTSHRLTPLNAVMPLTTASANDESHLSRTVPALDSLVSLYLLGAYVMKRDRL